MWKNNNNKKNKNVGSELSENFWDNSEPPTDLELIGEWLESSALS